MARHLRRLTRWLLGGIAGLLLLAVLAIAGLLLFVDPDVFRPRIQAEASAALGRPVRLTGRLRWQLGWRIALASEGGAVANAPGFGDGPLLSWRRIELGLAVRPLLKRQVLVDALAIEGLVVDLQRDAAGMENWRLPLFDAPASPEPSTVRIQLDDVTLREAQLRYRDAASGADWRITGLALHAGLPADFDASPLLLHDVSLQARVAGGPLQGEVPWRFEARHLRWAAPVLELQAFQAGFAEARVEGSLTLVQGDQPEVQAVLTASAPSLRTLLASVSITPPAMQDPATLGRFGFRGNLFYSESAARVEALQLELDDTRLTGHVDLPSLDPLSIRFELAADRADLDRYLKPEDANSEPFELPLAQLKALDARGVLTIESASVAGAAAKQVRIDVE